MYIYVCVCVCIYIYRKVYKLKANNNTTVSSELNIIQPFKMKNKENGDKGGAVVIMNTKDYINEATRLLSER